MKKPLSRRDFMATGMTAVGGLLLSGCDKTHSPPNFNGVFGPSEHLTMQVQRALTTQQTMAREYSKADISPVFPTTGTVMPETDTYKSHLAHSFKDWRLNIGGLVNTPLSLSLDEIKQFPSRTQITSHSCEEGWTAIGEWTGVPLSHLLQQAGLSPQARYVQFECEDDWYDALDMFDALHPQTILAYSMNGEELPVAHGAPLRLRVERKIGYKNTKYVNKITVHGELPANKIKGFSLPIDYGVDWFGAI